MANKEKVKSIIKDLMQQLYEAKGFDNLNCNPLERNIFEAEMKDLWDDLKDYNDHIRERNEVLESDNADLIDRNYNLSQENDKLKKRLSTISKVVNDTWS